MAYSPAQLAVGGALAPHVVITSNGGSLDIPLGLAFDGDGSLWVLGGTGTLTKFAKTSLAASGAPVPAARLHIHGYSLFWSVAFWPKPAGLPLH